MFSSKFIYNAIVRTLVFLIGMFILGLGISVAYNAKRFGVAAFDSLNLALVGKIPVLFGVEMTVGKWLWVTGTVLLVLDAIIAKRIPQILSVIPVLILGFCIDFWMPIASKFSQTETFNVIVMLTIGVIFISIGAAIYLLPDFPKTPVDVITLTLKEKTKLSFQISKTIMELSCLILSFFLGGPIGLGTVAITFTVGPLIQFYLKYFGEIYAKIIRT